jgi:hypothetical protein
MRSNEMWRNLRSIGATALTGGLMVLATHAPALGQAPGDEVMASVQHTGTDQGVVAAEIAWLANPITFHEDLTGAVVGDYLEIRGAVSCDAARMLAMRLAREASRMSVVDRIETAKAPAQASVDRPRNAIYKDAVQALYHGVPLLSRGLTVSTLDRGEVVVRGEVPTLEDKLAVSRCLKTVEGCMCVKNQVRARVGVSTSPTLTVSKPSLQDNSLLARLGVVQPRTEPPYSPQALAHITPSRPTVLPGSSPSVLVALPTSDSSPSPRQVKSEALPEVVATSSADSWHENRVSKSTPVSEPIVLTSASAMGETAKLRQAIVAACGVNESMVRVVGGASKALDISVTVADLEMGQRVAAKILAMPELVPYGISLDVSVAR